MQIETLNSIDEVAESHWNECVNNTYPFLSHGFLSAMEQSRCTSPETGWTVRHLVAKAQGAIVGVMPQYYKTHSWGEYVFDQDWANAYHQYRIPYYPKLLTAAPFTPATGPRWGIKQGFEEKAFAALLDATLATVEQQSASGFHLLFPAAAQSEQVEAWGLMKRVGCQFHWFNRGYECFEDFLAGFASRKRKNVRKERNQVAQWGLRFERRSGAELTEHDWQNFYELYASTYYKRGHNPHLNLECFLLLGQSMGDGILVDWVYAPGDNKPLAAALFFLDKTTLYGRYWGCRKEIDGLHFEVCFYRGIELAIDNGLMRFDPGAQGEHKISRGFEPVETCSYHWIGHPGFKDAIKRFLLEEKRYVDQYRELVSQRLPFKRA